MIVELISVGTELVTGRIHNTNATHIGRRLNEEGFVCQFQTAVADDISLQVRSIETALDRADAVVLTGGLGPTQDDLTRDALCRIGGRTMSRDESQAERIRQRVREQGRELNDRVLRMADHPAGSEGLPNPTGMAVGVYMVQREKPIFALPGVPAEMKPMLDSEVIPRLHEHSGETSVLVNRVLRVWGIGESGVASLLDDLFESTNPTLAFLIEDMEVQVRITARAADRLSATSLITSLEDRVRERLGDAVFGVDDESVESEIMKTLTRLDWTIGTIEVTTLGQVGARLAPADEGGSVYRGSVVTTPTHRDPPTPDADVILFVGAMGRPASASEGAPRPVEVGVTTPRGETSRVFHLGGSDERVRAFAAVAGLHMIRLAVSEAGVRS